ncbi:uncharacterized protein LOC120359205 [Solenopsis invicta]|uniref:uncharacterized protein LOC120359205 n=1 Tax=Solenopsis invicta TaxID=13686 RepID=UPI00193E5ADC|nr:uncharacterized protein LOC120359205 [Solenopsis invicta]
MPYLLSACKMDRWRERRSAFAALNRKLSDEECRDVVTGPRPRIVFYRGFGRSAHRRKSVYLRMLRWPSKTKCVAHACIRHAVNNPTSGTQPYAPPRFINEESTQKYTDFPFPEASRLPFY